MNRVHLTNTAGDVTWCKCGPLEEPPTRAQLRSVTCRPCKMAAIKFFQARRAEAKNK